MKQAIRKATVIKEDATVELSVRLSFNGTHKQTATAGSMIPIKGSPKWGKRMSLHGDNTVP